MITTRDFIILGFCRMLPVLVRSDCASTSCDSDRQILKWNLKDGVLVVVDTVRSSLIVLPGTVRNVGDGCCAGLEMSSPTANHTLKALVRGGDIVALAQTQS
jgi:hypothetical protein